MTHGSSRDDEMKTAPLPQHWTGALRMLGDVLRAIGFALRPGVECVPHVGLCSTADLHGSLCALLTEARSTVNASLWRRHFHCIAIPSPIPSETIGAEIVRILSHARLRLVIAPAEYWPLSVPCT
jgi:hypothetical protein